MEALTGNFQRTLLLLFSSVLSLRAVACSRLALASFHVPWPDSAAWPRGGAHLPPRSLPRSSPHGCSWPLSSASHLFFSNSPNRNRVVPPHLPCLPPGGDTAPHTLRTLHQNGSISPLPIFALWSHTHVCIFCQPHASLWLLLLSPVSLKKS